MFEARAVSITYESKSSKKPEVKVTNRKEPLSGDLIIGADGDQSIVRRALEGLQTEEVMHDARKPSQLVAELVFLLFPFQI